MKKRSRGTGNPVKKGYIKFDDNEMSVVVDLKQDRRGGVGAVLVLQKMLNRSERTTVSVKSASAVRLKRSWHGKC